MSRAFVKDDDTGPERPFERPVSDAPNYVTSRGLEQLRMGLEAAERAGDEREARYYRERIASAIVVQPVSHERGVVAFGAAVRAHDTTGRELRVRIVGEDEADPVHGLVGWRSPVAQALIDHRIGEVVTVVRPAGPISYTIDDVAYE